MSLEQKVKQKRIIRRHPSNEVLSQVEKGSKFVVVDDSFDLNFIPESYALINMNHKNDSFNVLIPKTLLYYMANPGEGTPDDALDEVSDFYGDAKDFEDDMIQNGKTSVQEADWATLSKTVYDTYLINKLVKNKNDKLDETGEPIPEYNQDTLKELDLNDNYVSTRIKAMAAVALGKNSEEIKQYDITDVLKHINIREERREKLSREEFGEVTCWAGSHYDLKSEYKDDNIKYDIPSYHGKDSMEGYKIIPREMHHSLDSKINELESEIENYRKTKRKELGKHDTSLLRQYTNLKYVLPENKRAQLEITPPDKK